MKGFFIVYFLIAQLVCYAQSLQPNGNNLSLGNATTLSKPSLDEEALERWTFPDRTMVSITNDGKFFTYGFSSSGNQILNIESTDKKWKREFAGATPVLFSSDSKTFVFQHFDTLFFLSLGKVTAPYFITNITSFKVPIENRGEWIGYQTKGESGILELMNLVDGKKYSYDSVSDFGFNSNGDYLLLQRNGRKQLRLIALQTITTTDVCQVTSGNITSVAIDSKGAQIAFTVQEEKNSAPENSIWYYKNGMDKAILKADRKTAGIDSGLYIQPSLEFSGDGRYIFLKLQYKQDKLTPRPGFVKINVWNYNDSLLQSDQIKRSTAQRTYAAVIPTETSRPRRILRLEHDHEIVSCRQSNGDFIVLADNTLLENRGDRFWMPFLRNFWLISLKDGTRTLLKQHGISMFFFSPLGRYLVTYDDSLESYFSYDLQSLKLKNISSRIPRGWLTKRNEIYPKSFDRAHWAIGPAGWLPNDGGILVYDNYDIWLLDLFGSKAPMNLTNGYGRAHRIKFNAFEYNDKDIIVGDSLYLAGYDTQNKNNGFFLISFRKDIPPCLLYMGPYTFYHWTTLELGNEIDAGMSPLKANEEKVWIVNRQSFNEAPNYFLTKDFKHFEQLTDFNPQENYNWVTAELVEFKQMDGSIGHGILYKPENFDPNKKYPILFNYYIDLTNRLYEFPAPEFTGDAHINIPWFISNGYLIFTPDINLNKFLPGPAAYNSVVGAAKWMAQKPYVDARRMGISGHSFGGGLTNYLVTHSRLFAAAFEGAGVSDLISSSLQLIVTNGKSRLQGGPTTAFYPLLWRGPDSWVKNSPIMTANKVTTPLLMFHCRSDGAVPFEQAVEFYLALQRLGKRVWFLEYDDGSHSVAGKNAQDLTIRVTQYFDHLLKGAPASIWQTRGIPASLKGIETGYSYDPSGSCGKNCTVCKYWNERMKKDSAACWREIEKRTKSESWMGGGESGVQDSAVGGSK